MAKYLSNITVLFLLLTSIFFNTLNAQQTVINLCSSPTINSNANQTQQQSASLLCDCTNESSSPWGLRVLQIDCSSRSITFEQYQAELLPIAAVHLDLSWNKFDEVPNLYGRSLKRLKFCHNQVQKIADRNFANIPNLRELDISWNNLELISMNAFAELRLLQHLDLSHNNLKRINLNTFSPLILLEDLNLSWNQRLNESSDLQELDFFIAFSVTPKLKKLRLGHCNLNSVILTHGVALEQLYLDVNNITTISDVPRWLKLLDLSGNPIEELHAKTLPHLFHLETLLLEDMPKLRTVDEYSLFGLPKLQTLSFQNSRQLNEINAHAFGMNVILNETDVILETLNLRGTGIKSLNSSLRFVFDSLKNLNLAGTPLLCDCDLFWVQQMKIETDGRCSEPSRLRGWRLSKVDEHQFDCRASPKWLTEFLNGLVIILLIVLCLGGIWLIVLGLRPKKVPMRKVGATSPYAPVTIEPNRAEY